MFQSLRAVALATLSFAPVSLSQTTLTADGIAAMGNNSLFTRWRPIAHVISPAGWMNDPCGCMYDANTETYHVLYQWHPQHVNWGNISWGHATSKDLITWTDVGGWRDNEALALGPQKPGTYDGLGIFTGNGQSVNLQGQSDGTLTVFYTSVSKLPIGWNIPYMRLSETQSIATSKDGGKTWERYPGNPVIGMDPPWNVTGFRDPFVEPFPELDAVLKKNEPHYYIVLGSGIRGVGPRIPLYSAKASDLTKWSFEGALWEPAENTTFGGVLQTGSYGFNFEVSGFFTLKDSKGQSHWFVNMGSEGGNVSFHKQSHWALWNTGEVTRRANGSALFTPTAGGVGDWGTLYALTTFVDTKHNRRVQWGWAPEDLGNFALTQQGFQGSFGVPRHVFVHEKSGVVNPPSGPGSSKFVRDSDGTFTAYTLGVRPLDEVVNFIRGGGRHTSHMGGWWENGPHGFHTKRSFDRHRKHDDHHGNHDDDHKRGRNGKGSLHMSMTVTLSKVTGPAGVFLAQSPDGKESTVISYSPGNHTIQVDRSKSSLLNPSGISTDPMVGYFEPYNTKNGEEDIVMDIFLDGSLLEIYVNDRFSLTTRIYPASENSVNYGTWLEKGASAQFDDMHAWIGMRSVWPERPADSSSPLVFDTPADTNDYVWWQGN